MIVRPFLIAAFLIVFGGAAVLPATADPIIVASKNFNESYVLAEILAQLLESRGCEVERRFGLGGTLVCFEALRAGEIDVYPEYSGTIEQAILKLPGRSRFDILGEKIRSVHGMTLLPSFGFNNTYAIALSRGRAIELGLETIGDLADHPELAIAFSHEFLERQDGWPGLAERYGLAAIPTGIEHGLAYQAIRTGGIDVTDVYSTDGDIRKYDLFLLEDDRNYFPRYLAAPLAAADADPRLLEILPDLAGRLDENAMQELNAAVVVEGLTFAEVASGFLADQGLLRTDRAPDIEGRWHALFRRTLVHMRLTLTSLLLGIAVALPTGVAVYRNRKYARPVIYMAGLLQTIPSIALLAFMIPLFGIGWLPAVIALFLYALLPILRNTVTALYAIDPVLKRVSTGMGLNAWERLRHIEIPLAAPLILAGIKTAAVINIGTATLAAFIGAGGLGEPIVTGLALNDTGLILEGAIPAAALAILTEFLFDGLERFLIPRHLLQKEAV